MIEITIVTNQKGRPLPWLASVRQRDEDGWQRILQRAFATNPEAWQWAQKIANTWKESSA